MTNYDRYRNVFISVFNIREDGLVDNLNAGKENNWDSIMHLSLCTALEDEFDIMFDSEDILELKSFEQGKKILSKYDIEI